MDPADLPEYLQLLMERVADDMTLHQREELAAAIYEFRDVFSSGPTDYGGRLVSSNTPLTLGTSDLSISHLGVCQLPNKRLNKKRCKRC